MRLMFLMLASLSLIPNAYAFDQAKLFDAFLSVVMIRGYNDDGSLAYGSGVVIAPNKVVTNCHIFRKTKEPWISRGEDSYRILSMKADRYHDMCLIVAEALPFKPAEIGNNATLKRGQEIVAIGHSSGVPAPLTSLGSLKSLFPFNNSNVIRSSARFAMGASGSGLFDTEGKLIGINTFKTPGRKAYFYALPIEWVAEIEKMPDETKFPIDGKAFWEEDDEQKPFFMQTALPEINEDWPKLAIIAERWIKSEPNNTDAWFELGTAQEHMGKDQEAEKSYRKALALNASNPDALFRIGILASQSGDMAKVKSIKLALTEINQEIADEFSTEVGCAEQCK